MITPNCRNLLTAADFAFLTKTLARTPSQKAGLVELLTDADARDLVLDDAALVRALLEGAPAALGVSQQLFFYVLTRHVLRRRGIEDRELADYIAALLENFSRASRLHRPSGRDTGPEFRYVSDLLLALDRATPAEAFLIRAHMGNYTLFLTGLFRESVERRSRRGAPDFSFYEEVGQASFRLAAHHRQAEKFALAGIYEQLAALFRQVRAALNEVADRLIHLGDDAADIIRNYELGITNLGSGKNCLS